MPGAIVFTGSAFIYFLCQFTAGITFPEIAFKVLQTPLQNLTDTLIGGIIIAGLQSVLFWAGIHGPNIVGGVVNPILMANALDNQALLDAGQQLVGNPQAKIITQQVTDVFIKGGGCGLTLGFLIAAFISAKSAQMKSISKLAFIPGLFNINEPIIFGLPIVFNPFFIVPFIGVPVLALILTYSAIAVGFLAPFAAVQVPWTTPPVIAGFLLGGWQGAVVQLLTVVISAVVYFPFVRIQDNIYYKEELADESVSAQTTGLKPSTSSKM
jgi:cellobiose PTS system EIIC component